MCSISCRFFPYSLSFLLSSQSQTSHHFSAYFMPFILISSISPRVLPFPDLYKPYIKWRNCKIKNGTHIQYKTWLSLPSSGLRRSTSPSQRLLIFLPFPVMSEVLVIPSGIGVTASNHPIAESLLSLFISKVNNTNEHYFLVKWNYHTA